MALTENRSMSTDVIPVSSVWPLTCGSNSLYSIMRNYPMRLAQASKRLAKSSGGRQLRQ